MKTVDLTIVVGSGRCGSTLLSRILRDHPEVLSVGELFTMLTGFQRVLPLSEMTGDEMWSLLTARDPMMDAMAAAGIAPPEMGYPYESGRFSPVDGGVPVISHAVLPSLADDPDALLDALEPVVRSWPRRPAVAHYRALFTHLAAVLHRRVIVERSGASLHLVADLAAAFPDARFVHMHRDGPDCAVSMSRHPGFRMIALSQRAAQLGGVPITAELARSGLEDIPPEAVSLLMPPLDGPALMSYPIPLPVFGAVWSSMILEGSTALDTLDPTIKTTLRYEDLLASPEAELTRLAAYLGITVDGDWLARARGLLEPSRAGAATDLPPTVREALHAACKPGMVALGLA